MCAALQEGLAVDGAQVLTVSGDSRWAVPLNGGGRPLPTDSAIWALFQGDQSALKVAAADPRSTLRLLPPEERQWVADGGFGVLLPLAGTTGEVLGVLAVGSKRSAAVFTADEVAPPGVARRLHRAAPGEPALAGQRHPASGVGAPDESDMPGRQCPACRAVGPPPQWTCACGADTAPAALPAVLLGKFRVEAMLGRGGMGVVYRAVDLTLGRHVALKTLPHLSQRAALRLRREARAMAVVDHPNLAFIYGAGELARGSHPGDGVPPRRDAR